LPQTEAAAARNDTIKFIDLRRSWTCKHHAKIRLSCGHNSKR
jgi:hypothetical protein